MIILKSNDETEPKENLLDEFEHGSSIGLAPFEDESSILIDEFETSSPNLLDEFDENVYFNADKSENESESDSPPEPDSEQHEEFETVEDENKISDDEKSGIEESIPGEIIDLIAQPPLEEKKGMVEPGAVIPEPLNPVFGFVCEHALNIDLIKDSQSRMIGRSMVHLLKVPCAGMVKPSWIKLAMDNGASGVFIVACPSGSCYHRNGNEILSDRLCMNRRPLLRSKCDRNRLRFYQFHSNERPKLLQEIDNFLLKLAELDNSAI